MHWRAQRCRSPQDLQAWRKFIDSDNKIVKNYGLHDEPSDGTTVDYMTRSEEERLTERSIKAIVEVATRPEATGMVKNL